MPVKLLSNDTRGRGVSIQIIQSIVANYKNMMLKRPRPGYPDSSAVPINPNSDPRCCWFSKREIDKLFNSNGFNNSDAEADPDKWGLRIYYGVHKDPSDCPPDNIGYINLHTVILVITHDEKTPESGGNIVEKHDQLKEGDWVSMPGFPSSTGIAIGQGLDCGTLCPPPPSGSTSCPGSLVS